MGCEEGTMGIRGLSVERKGGFDFTAYKNQVKRTTGRSAKQFKELQLKELTAARMRGLIRSQVQVSEDEAYLSFARSRDRATARVATLRTAFFQQFLVDPSADEQATWKAEHADELKAALELQKWDVGCPVVSEIRLDLIAEADDLKAAKKRLNKYRRSLRFKKPIGPLARSYSLASSASLGGLVGCVNDSYGVGNKEILEAVKDLKPGQTTDILETQRGLHLVQLQAVVTEENRAKLIEEFLVFRLTAEALAKDKARQFAEALIQKAKEDAPLLETLNNMIATEIKSELVASIAPEETHPLRPLVDITSPFGIEGNPVPSVRSMIDSVQKAPAVLVFDLAEANDVHPEPVELTTGFAVLQLKEKELTSRETFAKDRDETMTRLRMRKAEQVLSMRIATLLEQNGPLQMNPKYVQLTPAKPANTDAEQSEASDSSPAEK